MRATLVVLFLAGSGASSVAQQWWAPGACWVYQSDATGILRDHHYQYTNDTVVDGMQAQVALHTLIEHIPNGPTYTYLSKEYVTWQGNVILHRTTWPFPPYPFWSDWDTLYVLGDVGDRWWPIYADESCSPQGMLELQSVSTTIIDGVELATWDLAYLDSIGEPWDEAMWLTGGSLIVTERIGSVPRRPPPPNCEGGPWFDPEIFYFLHYSDDEISFPPGSGCDISTYLAERSSTASAVAVPNPGTDQLFISGTVGTGNRVEVNDALGRSILPSQAYTREQPIETSAWEPGTYFVSITTSEGNKQVLRWVKQ